MDKTFRKEKMALTLFFTISSLVLLTLSIFLVYYHTYGHNLFVLLGNKEMKAHIYTQENKNLEQGKTVFFGDSLTEFCDTKKFYGDIEHYNRGISGDTTQGMLNRVDDNVIALEPSVVSFLGGANDLNRGVTPEQIANNIEQILKKIRTSLPDCKIVVQSLYPVNPDTKPVYLNAVADRKNEDINKINALLPDICEKYDCVYVNMHDLLTDSEGRLKAEFTKDGLHVTDEAYEYISSILTPYLIAD